MISLLVVALVSAAPQPAPIRLASPGLSYINLEARVGDFFADSFAQQLALQGGILVTTKSEIQSLLGLERQKQLLGCSEQASSCMAELAGALGVDGLIVGSLARTVSGLTIDLKIIAANDGRTLGMYSARSKSDDDLLDWLAETAKDFAPKLKAGRGANASELVRGQPATSGASGLRASAWIPAVAGGVLAGGGAAFFAFSKNDAARLKGKDPTINSQEALTAVQQEGALFQTVGLALLAAGVASAAVAGGIYLFGESGPEATVSVVPLPNGGLVGLAGVFP